MAVEDGGPSRPVEQPSDDLASVYDRFYAQTCKFAAARARTLSGTEMKLWMRLVHIANPLTHTAESSTRDLADYFHSDERHMRRALDSLEDRGMVQPGERPGGGKTVYRLFFEEIAAVKMTAAIGCEGLVAAVKMTAAIGCEGLVAAVKMTAGDEHHSTGAAVKMTAGDSPIQAPLPGMVHGVTRADGPRTQDSRTHADSIDRFDKTSIDRSTILDQVLTAKPTDFDPALIAKASSFIHSYSVKLGRDPYANPPDNGIVAQFLTVAEWPRLEALIRGLVAERKEPGSSPAWFVTVAMQRIHGVSAPAVRQRRAQLRLEKGLPPTESKAPMEGYGSMDRDQNHELFQEEIKQLAKAKGMR